MHGPFAQPCRQVVEQLQIAARLRLDVEGEAVQEVVINNRQALLSHRRPPAFQPDWGGQPILLSQSKTKIEDILAPTVWQGVQSRWVGISPVPQHSFDLVHSEVIGVDDQHSRLRGITEQFAGKHASVAEPKPGSTDELEVFSVP